MRRRCRKSVARIAPADPAATPHLYRRTRWPAYGVSTSQTACSTSRCTASIGRLPLPLERARTLLALGSTQRQTRQRRSACETLEAALRLFEELGASLWSECTRAELGRISGRAPSHGELTPSERRVAELVAQGLTNREVAAALYVTQRTVEGTLSRVYGKLGHRSRAELGPTLAGVRPLTARSSKTGVSAA